MPGVLLAQQKVGATIVQLLRNALIDFLQLVVAAHVVELLAKPLDNSIDLSDRGQILGIWLLLVPYEVRLGFEQSPDGVADAHLESTLVRLFPSNESEVKVLEQVVKFFAEFLDMPFLEDGGGGAGLKQKHVHDAGELTAKVLRRVHQGIAFVIEYIQYIVGVKGKEVQRKKYALIIPSKQGQRATVPVGIILDQLGDKDSCGGEHWLFFNENAHLFEGERGYVLVRHSVGHAHCDGEGIEVSYSVRSVGGGSYLS